MRNKYTNQIECKNRWTKDPSPAAHGDYLHARERGGGNSVEMQPEVEPVVWLGVILVVLWVAMAMIVSRKWKPLDYWDDAWAGMAAGFFDSQSKSKLIIGAWCFTALLSAIGWLMALATVWKGMDSLADAYHAAQSAMPAMTLPSHRDDDLFRREHLYMQLCTAQLAILLAWTLITMAVRADWGTQWRLFNVFLLLGAAGVYIATTAVFFTIQDPLTSEAYRVATFVLLIVHCFHGLVWDFWYWGGGYLRFPADYTPLPSSKQGTKARDEQMLKWKMFEVSSFA